MLRRDWQHDKQDLLKTLEVYAKDGAALRLMMFPEGTTINARSLAKANIFALKVSRNSLWML